jgi:hypothetical protein
MRNTRPEAYPDAEGRFQVTTYTGFDGAPAAMYKITVTPGRPSTDGSAKPPPPVQLPEAYAKPTTTPLAVEITGKVQGLTIDMRSR